MSTPTTGTNNSGDEATVTPVTNVELTTPIKPKSTKGRQPVDHHGLTRKQKAFADYLIENPKASASEAIRQTYNVHEHVGSTVKSMASENLAKPGIQAYMASQGVEASNTAMKIMRLSAKRAANSVKLEDGTEVLSRDALGYARLAFDVSEAVNDRIHGKAVTKAENSVLKLSIQSVLD